MKVFITGGTGFLGRALAEKLLKEKHQVTILSRAAPRGNSPAGRVQYALGNPAVKGQWQEELGRHDVVINLAGASIFQPWTAKNKQAIYDSRILTTRNIADAIARHADRKIVLLSGSAVGFYGARDDEELVEESSPGNDFLARVVKDWEAEAARAGEYGARVVLCRIGVILGRDGGALSKMLSVFKWGLGSPLGSGKQWFSWVSLPDLVNIFLFLMGNGAISGPVNCTAPNPVTNLQMTKALSRALHRPVILPHVPAFLLKTVLGEFSNVFIQGQKVIPAKLVSHKFRYEFPEIAEAFAHLMD